MSSSPDPVAHRSAGGPHVAPADRALVDLVGASYIDAHQIGVPGARRWTAEQWARAMFEDDRRLTVRVGDLGLLGALLGPTQPPGRVAGWTVVARGHEWVRLESRSASTRDQVVVRVDDDDVALVTAVQYLRRWSGLLWRAQSVLHRRFAPVVLERAHRRLTAT